MATQPDNWEEPIAKHQRDLYAVAKGLHVADIQLQFTGSVDPTPLVMTGTGVLP